MLTMQDVSYSYRKRGKRRKVLAGATASFAPGKVYALFGGSGAGKTTCLCLLGGLDSPQTGEIRLDGKELREIGGSRLRRSEVSYVFQDYHLFPYMTAVENVAFAASIAKKTAGREQIRELLLSLGIDDETMARPVRATSGGQQQRIAIARALVTEPSYILADEPTGNLDQENTAHIMDILVDMAHRQKKCVIIATHSADVCGRADVRLKVDGGRLWEAAG
ncbi:MAG TPA: ABC transporter ATP-binding protein [Lachnospiraceae bacterium]|nr:ABC transporter ATP-binding protein [Lachnospiraceae bacterium]